MERGFTLLTEQFLEHTISAATSFEQAHAAATIEVARVAVVAFFTGDQDGVATARAETGFERAASGTSVTSSRVSIFALLALFQDAVAATRRRNIDALIIDTLIALALDVRCARRAVAGDALRTGGAFGCSAAARANTAGAEAALTLEVRRAGRAISVHTLHTDRTHGVIHTAGDTTLRGASIAVECVAIVALFTDRHESITAAGERAGFDGALAAAAIAIQTVAVFALFALLECSVAAEWCCWRRRSGRRGRRRGAPGTRATLLIG